nr:nucleotide-binding alpha-beta plait domain-containing protein [Tanacetum cinerariifolium]
MEYECVLYGFLTTVKDMKKKLEADMPTSNDHQSKENIYADLLGVTIPAKVVINNPQKSSNKGSKRKKVRLKLEVERVNEVVEDDYQSEAEYESDEYSSSDEDSASVKMQPFPTVFGVSISGFCLFVRGWQLAMVNMRSLRSKEDDVQKISSSVFVTNFPEQFSAKDLWNTCKVYGHVVDTYIPDRRSKIGKRFGFVHFINVFDTERLVNNL